jgi:hypothetical protein
MTKIVKEVLVAYTLIYLAIMGFAVVLVELYAKVSVWVALAVLVIQVQIFLINRNQERLASAIKVQADALNGSVQLMAEAITAQSRRITPIEELLTSKIAQKGSLPIN